MFTLKIYLIRHGETTWNDLGKFQGKTDTTLSEKGAKQAELLAERLRNIKLDCIYCSPLQRAAETAKPLAQRNGLCAMSRQELAEVDFGHWEGLTLDEIKERHYDEYQKCRQDPFTYGFRFGLEYDTVAQNVRSFIDDCIHNSEFESIAIVSHSVTLKMLLIHLVGLPHGFLHSFRLDNCSVSVIEYKPTESENKYMLVNLNDTGGF